MSTEIKSTMTVNDLALIRRAIMTVIDDKNGGRLLSGEPPKRWEFYAENPLTDPLPHEADYNRLDFAEAVQNYITERIALST